MGRMHNPPHPGSVLKEWLANVTVTHAAANHGVTRAYLSRILHGRANVSADMALRLAPLLGASAQFWMGMQTAYGLWQAQQKPRAPVQPITTGMTTA